MCITQDEYSKIYTSIAIEAMKNNWNEDDIRQEVASLEICSFPRCLEVIRHSPNQNEWFEHATGETFESATEDSFIDLYEAIARAALSMDVIIKIEHIREDEGEGP